MAIGVRSLGHSANLAAPGSTPPLTGLRWAATVAAGSRWPPDCSSCCQPPSPSSPSTRNSRTGPRVVATEKLLRLTIFITYLVVVAQLPHLQRVFQYHAAEHQTIACLEAGRPLTPEQAATFPRLHPRCGTSFMFLVMVVSFAVFAPLGNLRSAGCCSTPAWHPAHRRHRLRAHQVDGPPPAALARAPSSPGPACSSSGSPPAPARRAAGSRHRRAGGRARPRRPLHPPTPPSTSPPSSVNVQVWSLGRPYLDVHRS